MDRLSFLLFQLSDHANTAISKFVSYFGFAGIGGGAAIWATEKGRGAVDVATETAGMTIADWAGVVSIVAGIMLILQRIIGTYYDSRADKREEIKLRIKEAEARAAGLKLQLEQECKEQDDGK